MRSNKPYLTWRMSKMRRQIVHKTVRAFYRDRSRDIRDSIVVAGTARSGTTWLADIIAARQPCRILFEPFNPDKVEDFRSFHYFQYMRPDENDPKLDAYCQKILSGNIRHRWIDRQVEHLLPTFRVIKEIRANLFLRWIHDRFPDVPLLFIIRHPCAVVLSRMRLNWATDSDIQPFLSQPALIEDYLSDKMDVIENAQTPEEKHAVIWCISNLVPLRQFRSNPLHVIFYENLCTRPEEELAKVFETIGRDHLNSALEYVRQPSNTAVRNSAIVTGRNELSQWKEGLTSRQIRNILTVVKHFGLDYLYDDSLSPLLQAEPFSNSNN